MKLAASAIVLFAAAVLLAGCGTTGLTDLLGAGKSSAPGNISVQSNQNLAMPPDLRLPPPGTGSSESQTRMVSNDAPLADEQAGLDPAVAAPPVAAASPAQTPAGDIYERYGISKFHPDGKPKSDGQLQAELKKAYLAKKRQTDPNYGTIWNLGDLFTDG